MPPPPPPQQKEKHTHHSLAAFHVGPDWAPVGLSWGPLGPRLGLTGAHLGMLLGLLTTPPGEKIEISRKSTKKSLPCKSCVMVYHDITY